MNRVTTETVKNEIPWHFHDFFLSLFRNFQPLRQNFRSKKEGSRQKLDEVQKSCRDKFSIERQIFMTKSACWPEFLENSLTFPGFYPFFVNSLTFPWHFRLFTIYLTFQGFPGFPDVWSPWSSIYKNRYLPWWK